MRCYDITCLINKNRTKYQKPIRSYEKVDAFVKQHRPEIWAIEEKEIEKYKNEFEFSLIADIVTSSAYACVMYYPEEPMKAIQEHLSEETRTSLRALGIG